MKNLVSVKWWKASFFRALKTFCQIMLVLIGSDQIGFMDVDWIHIFSVAGMSAVMSIITSIAGLPEVDN